VYFTKGLFCCSFNVNKHCCCCCCCSDETSSSQILPLSSTVNSGSSHSHRYKACHGNISLLQEELRAVSNERDVLREMLRGGKTHNGFVGRSEVVAVGDGGVTERQASHNYEWLKTQCDRAMNELQSLKQQHSDTVRDRL